MFTNQERESLTLVSSRKTFVDMNKCMVCESSSKPVTTMSYLLPHVFDTRSNMLVFCERDLASLDDPGHSSRCSSYPNNDCQEKAVYVYMRECIAAKKLPTAKPLFNEDCEFTVIRTRGEESIGKLDKRLNLGWSSTANEITVWVLLDDTTTTKPLLLSLLFKANPKLVNRWVGGD